MVHPLYLFRGVIGYNKLNCVILHTYTYHGDRWMRSNVADWTAGSERLQHSRQRQLISVGEEVDVSGTRFLPRGCKAAARSSPPTIRT